MIDGTSDCDTQIVGLFSSNDQIMLLHKIWNIVSIDLEPEIAAGRPTSPASGVRPLLAYLSIPTVIFIHLFIFEKIEPLRKRNSRCGIDDKRNSIIELRFD